MSDNIQLELYKLAIDARDKLNGNYHKWMSFYYVAIGAVLLALTTVVSQTDTKYSLLILSLSLLGFLISTFWHLSCKGYYYWLKSCMAVIKYHEQQLLRNEEFRFPGVYTVFSKEVNEKKFNICIPTDYANISTPKLTLIFSFCTMLCWLIASIYLYFENFTCQNISCPFLLISIAGTVVFLGVIVVSYKFLVPKYLVSKQDEEAYTYI
jgi:hypothetical protein